jgi:hypothetical protein
LKHCFTTADSWWCCTPIYHAHHNSLDMPLHAYCQWVVFKRLIVGGFEGFMSFQKP